MKASQNLQQPAPALRVVKAPNTTEVSFTSFQKLILANTRMRKQVRDIVDLALFDHALRQNMKRIRAAKVQAEKETMELMMLFSKGLSDVTLFSRMIHRNRLIKTLALLDNMDQEAMVKRCI